MDFLHRNFLASELNKWRERKLIGPEQAEHIASLYEINLSEPNSRTNDILRIVAYFFFGCSLLVLVGANWEEIPRLARFSLLLGLTTIINIAGFLQLKKGSNAYGTALLFLGTLIFGASIALVAQIYNLGRHMPDGVLLCAVGAFATALATRKSLLGGLALAIALSWFIMESQIGGVRPQGFLLFLLAAIYIAYYESGRMLVLTIFVGVYCYLFNIYYFDRIGIAYNFSYCIFGVAISYVLAHFRRVEGFAALHNIATSIGIFCIILSLFYENSFFYLFGFDTEELSRMSSLTYIRYLFSSDLGMLFLAFCAGSIAIGAWLRNYWLVLVSALCLILPIIETFMVDMRIVYSFIAVIIGGVFIKTDRLGLGLMLIFTVAIVRYFELVGDYIGASILFLLFAIAMLFLIRKRKKI